MKVTYKFNALGKYISVTQIVHPSEILFTVACITCVTDGMHLAALPGVKLVQYLDNCSKPVSHRVQLRGAGIDDDIRLRYFRTANCLRAGISCSIRKC